MKNLGIDIETKILFNTITGEILAKGTKNINLYLLENPVFTLKVY